MSVPRPSFSEVELSQGPATLAFASFKVSRGQPLDVRLGFPVVMGRARLTLRTTMVPGNSNEFAWATFIGLAIQ